MPEGDRVVDIHYPTRVSQLEFQVAGINTRVAVVEQLVAVLTNNLDERLENIERVNSLAVVTLERAINQAQATADRAVAKAEVAVTKELLENQIEALRQALVAQIRSQKEAIEAALIAAKEALIAAMAASEKAIAKQEGAIKDRFESVNEFRGQLNDQAKLFIPKSEADLRFSGVDKKIEEIGSWRRSVEAALTAAQSKSGVIYAIIAMAIAAGGLLIATFNLFRIGTP